MSGEALPAGVTRVTLPLGARGEAAGLRFGDAPPRLLFLHANGFNAMTYRTLLAPLAAHGVLAADLRGHGRTRLRAEPKGRRSWHDLRDDLVALLDAHDGTPLVLAGHSMGGATAVMAARRRPDKVRGLVLFDPVMLPRAVSAYAALPWAAGRLWTRTPMVQAALKRRDRFPSREAAFGAYKGRGAFKTWPDEMLADYLLDGLTETGDGDLRLSCAPAWEASSYAAQAQDVIGDLMRLQQPVRLLQAERGSTARLGDVAARMRRRPNLRVETWAGTTHFLPMERREEAWAALEQMLGS